MNSEWFGVLGAAAGATITAAAHAAGRLVTGQSDGRRQRSHDGMLDAQKLRDELWVEVRDLRRRLDEQSAELERHRLDYIELLGKYTELHAEHKTLVQEHAAVKTQLGRLTPQH